MALLTTIPDNNYQAPNATQEAGNLAFLLEQFNRMFGGTSTNTVSPTVSATV